MSRLYFGLGTAAVVLVALFLAFNHGKTTERTKWELALSEAKLTIAELENRQPIINEVIVTEFVDRIQYIDRVRVQDRVVREYITVEVDQACTINEGFVVVHNAAATLEPLPSPDESHSKPSDVTLSQVAAVVADNYTKYHQVKAQLEALQKWITEQQKAWNQ